MKHYEKYTDQFKNMRISGVVEVVHAPRLSELGAAAAAATAASCSARLNTKIPEIRVFCLK